MGWRASAAAAAVLWAGAAAADDPPAAPPGAVVTHRAAREADVVALPLRRVGDGGPVAEPFEGRVVELAWRIPDAGPGDTPLSALRAEEARLAAQGFRTVLDCDGAACGGFDFRRAVAVLPPPAMALSLADFHALTLRRDGPEGRVGVVSALASRVGPDLFVQVTAVADGRPAGAAAPVPAPDAPPASDAAAPVGAEVAPPAAPATPPSPPAADAAGALGARLDAEGRAPLDGLEFLPGGAALAPGSEAALDAAAALLRARPALSVAVVGHTDGAGPLEANLRVGRARARAVAAALAARGIDPARLSAEGAGWLAPRASNATEAGRAANRRVELVAR
jgi:OOP family OmpA-OmpF porin